MHTTRIGEIAFIHHGGYDGEVYISVAKSAVEESSDEKYMRVKVPFDALKAFIACYVRSQKIGRLENADDDKVLGVK